MNNYFKFFNKGISTPVGILVIVIFTLLVVGILSWQWSELKKVEMPEIEAPEEILPPSPSGEEIIPKDETANWKIYRNEEYGFELRYPRNLKVVEKGPNYVQKQIEAGKVITGTVPPYLWSVTLQRETGSKILVIMGINSLYKGCRGGASIYGDISGMRKGEDIYIAGYRGDVLIIDYPNYPSLISVCIKLPSKYVEIVYYLPDSSLVNQILSTIRFIKG